jgi:hypothetical protein
MDPLVLILRLIHIVGGATWVGMAVFAGFYLTPSLQEVGPEGGKVMAALQRRGLMKLLPVLAIATLISGFWLYWRASVGLDSGYASSPIGIAFGTGGVLALVGYALGMMVLRPSMMQAGALAQGLQEPLSDAERAARRAEIGRLRGRSATAGKAVALLLILAAALMAVARYL